jgi:tetratricopeptide (TPR) repeat protein
MKASRVAIAAFLVAGGLAVAVPSVATAQQPRTLTLSNQERTAVAALQAAAAGPDRAAQDGALSAARAAAQGADARYAVANLQFQIGRARGDNQMQTQAIDAMIASGVPDPAELVPLLAHQASRAYSAGDVRRTDALLGRMVELQPNNPAVLADHAQMKARLGNRPEAVALLQRAIAAQRATGQPVPESWYLRAVAIAIEGRLPQSTTLARELIAAYPSPINWRDVLLTYRAAVPADPALTLDISRLVRSTQALSGERDYLEFARALIAAGLPGEAKAVLDEGLSRGMLTATEAVVRDLVTRTTGPASQGRSGLAALRTRALAGTSGQGARTAGDTAFGYGQYAEAAELYQAALQKGGEDPNLVNSRLGAALALAGRRPEAEAALRAVTGPRADLAGFWLAWLARRTA